jgi:DNA-binding beta-propeller fold protein YncE
MRFKALILTLTAASSMFAQSAAQYKITESYLLGGEGGWDYIIPDTVEHRIYIARQNRLMVVDEDNGKLIGEVRGINGAHGTAIVHKSGLGFATSGEDRSVVIFDLNTLKVTGRVTAEEDADAILFDQASNRVFTLNGDAHSSTVIDGITGKFIKNISLEGKPEYGVSSGDGKVYANLVDTNEIVELDSRSLTVTRRWSTAPCKQPVAMAIDIRSHRLFSGCRSGVMAVSDYKKGAVVTTLPFGTGVDGAGYDPTTHDAFASNADGTLTVIHQDGPDQYRVIQNLKTAVGSRNMGLDVGKHRIYVVSAKFGTVPEGSKAKKPVLPGAFTLLRIEADSAKH